MISPFFSGAGFSGASPGARFLLRREIGIEFLQDLLAGLLDIHIQVLEHARGHAVALAQQAQQDVLGADVGVIEGLGLLLSQRQDLLHPRRVGDVAHHLLIGPGAHLLLHFQADGLQVEAELLQDIDGHALAQLDEAEQKVLGADEVMVETVGFLPRQREHLLRARGEIVHGFLIAHTIKMQLLGRFVQSGARPMPAAGRPGGSPAANARAPCLRAASPVPRRRASRNAASASGPAGSG